MIRLMPPSLADSLEKLDLRLDIPQEIPELETLLYDTVLAGGKRFRPALCLMMGGVFGVAPEKVSPYARVAELMHAATLAHDDVIDEATKRRHRPTLNRIASNQKAILTGDLLLARVVNEIATLGNLVILREGAQVLEDLVRGEWVQIERRGKAAVTRAQLEHAAHLKTASLIAWCCTTPARLAGASEELVQRCARLGQHVGLAFQMADDILDFEKDGEKHFANDLYEGLVNFVVLEVQERNPSLQTKVSQILETGVVQPFPWTDDELQGAKESVRTRVRALLQDARNELAQIHAHAPNRTHLASSSALPTEDCMAREALDSILALMAERVH